MVAQIEYFPEITQMANKTELTLNFITFSYLIIQFHHQFLSHLVCDTILEENLMKNNISFIITFL
jgi:hypothetical protein